MKKLLILLVVLIAVSLSAADNLYLNGLNEATYIYRTAEDSLHSYFRDAFSFSLGYRSFTIGMKFLAELPKYSTDQNQLLADIDPNKLSTRWTERYLEYEKDNLLLHGGTITESFGSGMVFRAWEDLEFDTDTRLDGFLVKYDDKLKLKALYGALPNRNQSTRSDLAYGIDAQYPVTKSITAGASLLTMRTLNLLGIYNQQDVYAGRLSLADDGYDGSVEYAATSLFNNSGVNHEGTGINANANIYLTPSFARSLTLGAGYKYYDNFQYRLQDLKANNYHNETLADNSPAGSDEEGLQGTLDMTLTDYLALSTSYAEAWDSAYKKRMNDLYAELEWHLNYSTILFEYSHIEKLDKETDHWQQDLKPALSLSMPLRGYSFTAKAEYQYIEKVSHEATAWHYEPLLQLDLGKGNLSVSLQAESWWKDSSDMLNGIYWANAEIKYSMFKHTDLTLFAGKQAGGKVCRNGICRYVAPFQGVKLEAVTRF